MNRVHFAQAEEMARNDGDSSSVFDFDESSGDDIDSEMDTVVLVESQQAQQLTRTLTDERRRLSLAQKRAYRESVERVRAWCNSSDGCSNYREGVESAGSKRPASSFFGTGNKKTYGGRCKRRRRNLPFQLTRENLGIFNQLKG